MKLLKQTAVLGLSALVMGSSMVVPMETALSNGPATEDNNQPNPDEVTRMLSRAQSTAPQEPMTPEELAAYQEVYKDSWQRALQHQQSRSRLSFLKKMLVPKWFRKDDAVAAMARSIPLTPVAQANEAVEIQKIEAVAEPEAPAMSAPDKIIPANTTMEAMKDSLAELIERNTPPVADTLGQAGEAVQKAAEEIVQKAEAATKALDAGQSLVVMASGDEMTLPAPLKAAEAFTLLSSGLDGLQEMDGSKTRTSNVALPKSPWNQLASAEPTLDAPPAIVSTTADAVVLKSGITKNLASLDLTLGKAKVLHLSKPAARVSISDPDVASAVVISPTQIQLVGRKVGVANLLVWSDAGSANHTAVDINVHRDVSVLVRQLQFVDPGIEIVPMAAEDTVILTGEARDRESAQLAVEIAKAYFASGGGGGIAGAMSGGDSGGSRVSSNAPGSAIPGSATNLINLIKVKGEPSTKLELVRNRLKQVDPNIKVEVVPGSDGSEKIVLTGRVLNASTAAKALNLAAVFYGQPGIKVVSGPGGNAPQSLQSSGGGGQGDSGQGGGGGMLAGGGSSGGTQSASANILQGAVVTDASGNVISLMEIAQKPQIRCTVKFLEIQKTGLDAIGATFMGAGGNTNITSLSGNQGTHISKPVSALSPDSSYVHAGSGGTGEGTVVAGTAAGTVASALSQVLNNGTTHVFSFGNYLHTALQLLEEKRMARTLAEPTLTMLSGEQASFLAGGEVPIPMIGGNGQIEVQFHEVGIRLNMAASVTDEGKIHMEVEPEVSSVDHAFGTSTNFGALPGFKTRRTHSTVQIQPGQSFVMAGLFNQEDVDSISGLPGVSKLPIIGNLFRNKWNERKKTELVVIIQPEILMNPDAGVATTPQPDPYRAAR